VVGDGRFGTDRSGFAALMGYLSRFSDRIWALEGCNGIGRHVASRLVASGQEVVDVPPKLSARARVPTPALRTSHFPDPPPASS
jgi:hypothetical protein